MYFYELNLPPLINGFIMYLYFFSYACMYAYVRAYIYISTFSSLEEEARRVLWFDPFFGFVLLYSTRVKFSNDPPINKSIYFVNRL